MPQYGDALTKVSQDGRPNNTTYNTNTGSEIFRGHGQFVYIGEFRVRDYVSVKQLQADGLVTREAHNYQNNQNGRQVNVYLVSYY